MTNKRSLKIIAAYYVYQLRKAIKQQQQLWPILRNFIPYFSDNRNVLQSTLTAELPWLTYEAIRQLKGIISSHMKVFEYGSGGSTLFLAKRANEVISIEHDKDWYQKVSAQVLNKSNVKLILVQPDTNKNEEYLTHYGREGSEYSFKDYVSIIDTYPDNYFDVILIDGRARTKCYDHAWPKLKKEGFLVFDNTEREMYHKVTDRLSAFLFHRSYGPVVHSLRFSETSIYQK
jgi:hypothetical protein